MDSSSSCRDTMVAFNQKKKKKKKRYNGCANCDPLTYLATSI